MSGEKVSIEGNAPERISHGHKAVTTAGTAVALVSASTACYKVLIQAKHSNTNLVFIGGASVPNDYSGGIALAPGDATEINTQNLDKIYVNSLVNGEGVSYIYWNNYRATVGGKTY